MTTRYNLLFCLLFGAMCVVYRYDQWLRLPPAAIHQWRQADGYALSAHYARGAAFHAPMQYNLFTNGDNQTVGELPLLYWLAGTGVRCLGTSAYTLRWIGLALMLAGAWVIGWVALRLTRKPVLSALLTALVHTAPILAYYGPGYLPDTPAFYLSILAGGSLFQAERQQRAGWLWIAGFFSALAIMIKISTVLLPGAMFMAWLWGRMRGYWRGHNIWGSWMPAVVACGVGAAVVACRWWITVYNDAHQAHYFLADIRPIWWYQLDAIRQILWDIIRFGLPAYASAGLYLAVAFFLWWWVKYWRTTPFVWHRAILVLEAGVLLYFLLWFRMLCEHDYYAICLLILPVLIVLQGVTLALQKWSAKTITRLLLGCWLVGLVHCSYVLQKRMHLAIAPQNTLTLPPAAFLTPQQLEATGLPTFARLLCPEDPSPNIYLSALQRPGWTNYNFQQQYTADALSHYCQKFGLTHLALRDTSAYTPLFREVFSTKTAQLAGWHIYSGQ